jgi:hypothetical protein
MPRRRDLETEEKAALHPRTRGPEHGPDGRGSSQNRAEAAQKGSGARERQRAQPPIVVRRDARFAGVAIETLVDHEVNLSASLMNALVQGGRNDAERKSQGTGEVALEGQSRLGSGRTYTS